MKKSPDPTATSAISPSDLFATAQKMRDDIKKLGCDQLLHHVEAIDRTLARLDPNPRGRHVPLGIGPIPFPPGAEASVITRPQLPFKPEHLVLPEDVAQAFMLHDLKVGVRSQGVNCVSIPCDTFSLALHAKEERLVDLTRWDCDAIMPGQELQLIVSNESGKIISFRGVFWGRTVDF